MNIDHSEDQLKIFLEGNTASVFLSITGRRITENTGDNMAKDIQTINNTNGADNASCPKCGTYNAMLGEGDYINGQEIHKCRDCGEVAFIRGQAELGKATPIMARNINALRDLTDRLKRLAVGLDDLVDIYQEPLMCSSYDATVNLRTSFGQLVDLAQVVEGAMPTVTQDGISYFNENPFIGEEVKDAADQLRHNAVDLADHLFNLRTEKMRESTTDTAERAEFHIRKIEDAIRGLRASYPKRAVVRVIQNTLDRNKGKD